MSKLRGRPSVPRPFGGHLAAALALAAALLLLLLAAVSLPGCSGAQLFGGLFKAADPLKRIDQYLETSLGSEDQLEANLAALRQWYASTYGADARRAKKSKFAPQLSEFLQLEQTLQVESCNREGHQLLAGLERQLISSQAASNNKLARVDTIVRDAQQEHARLCAARYPENYRRLVEGQPGLQQVAEFLPDALILGWLRANKFLDDYKQPFESLLLAGDIFRLGFKSVCHGEPAAAAAGGSASRRPLVVAQLMLDAIRRRASKEADGKLAHRCLTGQRLEKLRDPAGECQTEAKRLFRKYIEAPCQAYVEELGPDVFRAHRYDLRSHMPPAAGGDVRKPTDYQLAWARFEYCQSLEDLAEGLAKEVASLLVAAAAPGGPAGQAEPVAC